MCTSHKNSCRVTIVLSLLVVVYALLSPLTVADCHFKLPGDLNNDCQVNLEDFMVVAQHWLIDCTALYDPVCIPLDLDGDGYNALNDCDDSNPAIYPGAREICNGLDDDCDGAVDDDCSSCIPAPEICDGLDNDCDGSVDEGNPGGGTACGGVGICHGTITCQEGELRCIMDVGPRPEICNDLDDDCDGVVDNDCTVCEPSPEACNGLDDDCDGAVDEGNPGGGIACTTGMLGVCAAGTTSCVAGALMCMQNQSPIAEICNGLDDDCDGTVDNNCSVCVPSPEACNGLDDDCDGAVDEGNPGGGIACDTGMPGVCSAGTTSCIGGALVCNPNQSPVSETCNGLDDDCDGVVDENIAGVGASCDTGMVGVCSAGTTSCISGALVCNPNQSPVPEICNGLDDDCDGAVDNNCSVCVPSPEACNGLDDDCDGAVDEGNPGGGVACNTGLMGICETGTTSCIAGALSCMQNQSPITEICNGLDDDCDGTVDNNCSVCVPSPEACNGLDDDCDGAVDEGNPGGGAACNTGATGVCSAGATSCQNGVLMCVMNQTPGIEQCNGLDDDCDGSVDEGNPGGGVACYTGKLGICAAGVTSCQDGALMCSQKYLPEPEICDGLDNDCDGIVDENIAGCL